MPPTTLHRPKPPVEPPRAPPSPHPLHRRRLNQPPQPPLRVASTLLPDLPSPPSLVLHLRGLLLHRPLPRSAAATIHRAVDTAPSPFVPPLLLTPEPPLLLPPEMPAACSSLDAGCLFVMPEKPCLPPLLPSLLAARSRAHRLLTTFHHGCRPQAATISTKAGKPISSVRCHHRPPIVFHLRPPFLPPCYRPTTSPLPISSLFPTVAAAALRQSPPLRCPAADPLPSSRFHSRTPNPPQPEHPC